MFQLMALATHRGDVTKPSPIPQPSQRACGCTPASNSRSDKEPTVLSHRARETKARSRHRGGENGETARRREADREAGEEAEE